MAETEKVSHRPAIYHVDDEQHPVAEDTMAVPEHRDPSRYPDGYTCRFVRPNRTPPHPAQDVVQ